MGEYAVTGSFYTGCSIASVTTAYNSARELGRHIDALLAQRRPLQEVIVVDDASTDGTSCLLAKHYPQVTVLRMPENLGVGAALAAGLSYAVTRRCHDYIWMFDQDSIPAPGTLGVMMQEAAGMGEDMRDVGILASFPVDKEMKNSSTPWLWRNRLVKPPASLFSRPVFFADLVITSGSMVRRDVIEQIGFPRSDFFIDFVDYEYCLRARKHGYRIAVVTSAILRHEIGKARKLVFFGRPHLWSEHRAFREYYYSRNLVYSVWHLCPGFPAKAFALLHLARHAGGVVLFGSERLRSLSRMIQGIYDGCKAKLGIRFLPEGPTALAVTDHVADNAESAHLISSKAKSEFPGKSTHPSVYIVLLNWNGWQDTVRCIASLKDIEYPNWEVVVVDNGSSDDSVLRIKDAFPEVPILETGKNLGFAAGNNVGIRFALKHRTDYVFVLNNDTTVFSDTVSEMVWFSEAHPRAAMTGPKIHCPNPERDWAVRRRMDLLTQMFAFSPLRRVIAHVPVIRRLFFCTGSKPAVAQFLSGSALFFRAAALDVVGLFDENTFLDFEELIMAEKVRSAGFSIYFVPQASIWHKQSASASGLHAKRYIENAKSEDYFLSQYVLPSLFERSIIMLIRFVTYGARALRYRNYREHFCEFMNALKPRQSNSVNKNI